MEIDEVAARLVRQYWVLLAICVVVPLAIVGALVARQPAMYAASARIITSSAVPVSASEADAIVSQVQGIATGPAALDQALQKAGVSGSFPAKNLSVVGLGTSQVVDITATDRNPRVAQRVAQIIATEVVNSLNKVGQSGLSAALGAIDSEIVTLTEQRSTLAAQVTQNPKDSALQSKLAGLDQVIANFTGDRSRLLIQTSTDGLANVLDQPTLPRAPESKALVQKVGLAALLGIVLGILLAAIAEMARPTVPGARRVGRRLNAPMLGTLKAADLEGERTPYADSLVLQLRLAAVHAGLSSVALFDLDGARQLDGLADMLTSAMPPTQAALAGDAPAGAADNGSSALVMSSGARSGTAALLTELVAGVDKRAVRVMSLQQLQRRVSGGPAGIVVLSGPAVRVSRISAVDDLSVSSGWPIIGVVGIPRRHRRWPGSAAFRKVRFGGRGGAR